MLKKIKEDLEKAANPEKVNIYQRFFKTGKGEYGEGDIFIGLTVPKQREIAKKYVSLDLNDVKDLLSNKVHEYRLTGFLILVYKFEKADEKEKKNIVEFYLKNIKSANNWDLIDCVADKILGNYLIDKDKEILYELAKTDNLWKKRIAIISTFGFIKNNQFEDTLKISEILLKEKHDLIHKAVGWMLREVGKRDIKTEEVFLKKYYKTMPRTMLRYAIEKFDSKKKAFYMNRKI
ncbi:DNA alkylation repair protein [Candidatus Woesearchaeota archaeon]|nr:DNA alkylation repair protein [Candidatus Woesearchaeota archaeon]